MVADRPHHVPPGFVGAASQSLGRGRFLVRILGDGIREGAASIAELTRRVSTLEFTFGLVELAQTVAWWTVSLRQVSLTRFS